MVRKQSFYDLWFVPVQADPQHMYYVSVNGIGPLILKDVVEYATESAHPDWDAAARNNLTRCYVSENPDVILVHDETDDPRFDANSWAACPKHGPVRGPAFLAWRSEWQRRVLPEAAAAVIYKRDGWRVTAWEIERQLAPVVERMARMTVADGMPETWVTELMDVVAPALAYLCDSTLLASMFGRIREAGEALAQCRRHQEPGVAQSSRSAASCARRAAEIVIDVLRECSREGLLWCGDLAGIGA